MQTFTCDAPKIFSKTEVALVDEEITADQPGRVKFQTTYWPAILFRDYSITLYPGEEIAVVGRQGITLLVQPLY